jgi:hypothetical protein
MKDPRFLVDRWPEPEIYEELLYDLPGWRKKNRRARVGSAPANKGKVVRSSAR